jgi:hypothetical protein
MDYENMADTFLGGAKPPPVMECLRKKGDTVRFDPTTDRLELSTGVESLERISNRFAARASLPL